MAQLITVRLSRPDASPWGFRLQGGKDFGTPLVIQKVNGGSIAERAGLIAGDSVVKVNSTDVFNLRHKDAQDVIVKAGQTFEVTVQRGGSTWKPTVIPTGNVPKPQSNFNNVSPVTKTSLAAKKQDFVPIGSAHNVAAKGFTGNAHLNGNAESPKLVNKQYNSPIGLYSEESIAETLSAQTEVLPTGALGVNFKKNEKNYNSAQSEVFKMLQEVEKEPHDHHDAAENIGTVASPTPSAITGLRHFSAPENKPTTPTPQLPPGQNICGDCERLIVGVFVRIKDKNLHVECFKCATCGTSLKNVGYYNINHKLYCDIHAKLAVKSNPPGPNMVPVTIPPGGKAPVGTISAALASHSLPSPSPKSPSGNFPPPFQTKDVTDFASTNGDTRKDEAITKLISVLSIDKPQNGVGNNKYVTEKTISLSNNELSYDINNGHTQIHFHNTTAQNTNGVKQNSLKYPYKTGANLSGPKPFSSIGSSSPMVSPVSAPFSNTLPRAAPPPSTMAECAELPQSIPENIPDPTPPYIPPKIPGSNENPQMVSEEIETETNKLESNPNSGDGIVSNPGHGLHNPGHEETNVKDDSSNPGHNPHKDIPKIEVESDPKQNNPETLEESSNPGHSSKKDNPGHNPKKDNPGHNPKKDNPKPAESSNPGHNPTKKSAPKSGVDPPKQSQKKNTVKPGVEHNTKKDSANPGTESSKPKQSTGNPKPGLSKSKSKSSNPGNDSSNPKINVSNPTSGQETTNPITYVSTSISGSHEYSSESKSIEITEAFANQAHKMSICSAEVMNITGRRSAMECAGTISDSIGTQMLVNTVTQERPKSPPPIPTINNPTEGCAKECSLENPGNPSVCPKINPEIMICPKNIEDCHIVVQGTLSQTEEQHSLSKQTMSETSTSITNPVQKDRQSPVVKALTVTSSKPFTSVSFTIEQTTKEPGKQETVTKTVKTLQSESREKKSVETTFPHIEVLQPLSIFASALSTAPDKPFEPQFQIHMEKVELPEEKSPYEAKNIPITVEPQISHKKEVAPSLFVQALTTAPERPYSPIVIGFGNPDQTTPPEFLKDLPKPPKENMSMLTALTTACERPFTPVLSIDLNTDIEDYIKETEITRQKTQVPKKIEYKPIIPPKRERPVAKPASHLTGTASAFKPFKPVPQSIIPVEENADHSPYSFPPVSDELKSFKKQVEETKLVEEHKLREVQKEEIMVLQEEAQAEEIKKLYKTGTSLHKPDNIPGYQKNLQHLSTINVKAPTEQPKAPPTIQKPVITVGPGQMKPEMSSGFQPVSEDNVKFSRGVASPMPYALSPSIINRPAPLIPQYQIDLLPKHQLAVDSYLLDPKSPGQSRSPSPMPGRVSSPFPGVQSPHHGVRPQSPAVGPPPNPLFKAAPIRATPVHDEKYMEAKENLQTYIPKHQGRVEQIKKEFSDIGLQKVQKPERDTIPRQSITQTESYQSIAAQVANSRIIQQKQPELQISVGGTQSVTQKESYQNVQMAQAASQKTIQTGQQITNINQAEAMKHVQQFNKSQTQSVEKSADNSVQIQRTRRVQEEFERTQKYQTVEIAKTSTGIKQTTHQTPSIPVTTFATQPAKPVQPPQTFTTQPALPAVTTVNPVQPTPKPVPTFATQPVKPFQPVQTQPTPKPVPTLATQPVKPFQPVQTQPTSKPSSVLTSTFGSSYQPNLSTAPKQFKPAPKAPITNVSASAPNVPPPNTGAAGGKQSAAVGVAPKRGRGVLNLAAGPGLRVPLCAQCNTHIRGPFITALGKIWCPDHFVCVTPSCRRPLQDLGFVEERGQLYCEYCFEQYLAPACSKCSSKIKGDCLNAIGKHFHPECFNCAYCGKLFGNSPFFLEDSLPYCETDWNELFTTKCFACGFPVEAGDRWVEALNNNYHSQCFNCTMCKKNLEGQSFYAKGGRPYCKNHAR